MINKSLLIEMWLCWGCTVFEFFGKHGVTISPDLLNIVCTHKIKLSEKHLTAPQPQHKSAYSANALMTVFDFALPSVQTPIIGLTLYEGIGYAQLSYLSSDGQKRARVWITINPSLLSKALNIKEPKYSNDFIDIICQRLNITAYIYDSNPLPSKVNWGLEVYNERGELVFDSEYTPMKVGKKSNINDGKHIIFINRFFAFHYESGFTSGSRVDLLDVMQCQPFLEAFWAGKIYDFKDVMLMAGLQDELDHEYHLGRYDWYFNTLEKNAALQSIVGYL
ncbi:Uncharacterised protein [Moraxella lacunata]|uniref:Uncharacterized protein n=1 Tax=Moraxella lacunata TaxID=477 RepID=A0A378T4P1_MORLA|nr:hypothetical protein [Moraxella lacunata]STZ55610.1 Uncharacterised protein [Moraxella lacunata]